MVKSTSISSLQKEFPVLPPAKLNANIHNNFPTDQHAVGLSATAQSASLSEPNTGRIANLRKGLAGSEPRKSFGTGNVMAIVQPSLGLAVCVTRFSFSFILRGEVRLNW